MTIHFDRLLKLADFLETVPEGRFDFGHWAGEDWRGAQDLSCGTSACAMGWAPSIPEFAALGLRLARLESTNIAVTVRSAEAIGEFDLAFDLSAEAGHHVFGLEMKDFVLLFTPREHECDDEYCGSDCEDAAEEKDLLPADASAKDVAAHIRRFVEERRP